ncbi:hypothetical protein HanPSC8_Chr06g0259281 [Helianthus annuus]|nr:hypothetical protein HanPSC8_Chr06g0259281 [Helianthus annuus]
MWIFLLVVGSSTMVLVDAELERLLKETGKQLSLPHDYVDELLQVLDLDLGQLVKCVMWVTGQTQHRFLAFYELPFLL